MRTQSMHLNLPANIKTDVAVILTVKVHLIMMPSDRLQASTVQLNMPKEGVIDREK